MATRQAFGFGTPFAAQLEYLRQKLDLPTERWDDITGRAQDKAFVVAGVAKADMLADLHQAVLKTATDGTGINAFRKDFKSIVAQHGWTGWTGEGTKEGEAWRTRVIYQTNMATSYAAGRYAQMTDPEVLKLHPYWRYLHSANVLNPREQHLAWHGLTLPWNHPFWQTHFAPNGYGCQCRVTSVTRKEGEASARAGLGEPPAGWDAINPATGEQQGIGRGFGYAPGANVARSFQSLVDDKLLKLDAPIGAAMWEVLKPVLLQERLMAWQTLFDATRKTMRAGANTAQVHTVAPTTVADLATNGVVMENAAIWLRDHELVHALRDTKTDRGAALPDDVWRDLPLSLDAAKPYLDTQDNSLIYAIDLGADIGKIAVRVNLSQKGRFDGVRATIVSNFIQTGGLVAIKNMTTGKQYVPLKK